MTDDERDPAAYAADIDAARERMIGFVTGCSDEEWARGAAERGPPAGGGGRGHVAHAYEYLAGWISQLVAGQPVEVNGSVVDALNAQHARDATAVSKTEATEHLRRSGEAISVLVAGLSPADLAAGDGRVRRLAQIAARHADDHRADIETALAAERRCLSARPIARVPRRAFSAARR